MVFWSGDEYGCGRDGEVDAAGDTTVGVVSLDATNSEGLEEPGAVEADVVSLAGGSKFGLELESPVATEVEASSSSSSPGKNILTVLLGALVACGFSVIGDVVRGIPVGLMADSEWLLGRASAEAIARGPVGIELVGRGSPLTRLLAASIEDSSASGSEVELRGIVIGARNYCSD